MKKEYNRDTSTSESGQTNDQGGKAQQDNDNAVSGGTPVKGAKPEPPPLRVIIEGGRPGDLTR